MSFHPAPPNKRGSSGNFQPLGDFPEQTSNPGNNSSSDVPDDNAAEQRTSTSESDDEEMRFELLSAYLDNEVTSEERQLVAQWLRDDPKIQQMYQRLLMLRQAIRTAPVPSSPPLHVPSPKDVWEPPSSAIRWTLVCATTIALLGSMAQLGTTDGRQHLNEAWQFIQSLPQGTLLELATTALSDDISNSHSIHE